MTVRKKITHQFIFISTIALVLTRQYLYPCIVLSYLQLPLLLYFLLSIVQFKRRGKSAAWLSSLGIIILSINIIGNIVDRQVESERVVVDVTELSILSYNIYFKNNYKTDVIELLTRENADLVCLQEVTPEWELLLNNALGYKFKFAHPANSAHGLAVYSKYPLDLKESETDKGDRSLKFSQ